MTDGQKSMLDLHNQALASVDEAYHNFLLIYKKNAQCVYGFVEGKDDPLFYKYLIESQLPEGWAIRLIPSGSKRKTILALKNFNWASHSKKRICFFVDRDLQDFLAAPQESADNLYVTDGYSIENSILQDELVFAVLADIYQITQLQATEEEKIKKIIHSNEAYFFESMMPLMGQILLWSRAGSKANLNNLKLDELFSFSGVSLVAGDRNSILTLAAKQVGCALCDEDDIAAAEQEIRNHANSQNLVRGKYVLWLFVKQCEAIWNAIPGLLTRFSTQPKKRINYGWRNAMVIVAPRARIPNSLRAFIAQNYLAFIAEINKS